MTGTPVAPGRPAAAGPAAAYAIALLLAAAQVAVYFPPAFLAGHGLFFFDGDVAKDVTGWLFYRRDDWHLPLLHTRLLDYPQGVSIALTDSIPLMALLLKPFSAWLPPAWHYFGLWHALVFAAQAFAAVFLIRSLGRRSGFAALAAAGFAITWPVLLYRFGHSALLAQALPLFALGCYFRGRRGEWPPGRVALLLVVTCQLALFVHPYLLALCYAVLTAYLVEEATDGRPGLQLARLAGALLLTLGLAALAGYVGHGGLSTGGYGRYGLDLLAPFCGGRTSRVLACTPGANGESYAYLGAGLLLLLPAALWLARHRVGAAVRRHRGLLAVCGVLAAFAVTHRVHVAGHEVLAIGLPARVEHLFGMFQASARAFWLVGYLALFATLAAMLERGRAATLLVAAALALQWYDIGPRRADILANARAQAPAFDPAWQPALDGVAHVAMYPAFGCGGLDPFAYLPPQYLAAVHGATFSTAYAARSATDCAAKHAAFADAPAPDELWLAPAAQSLEALPPGFALAAEAGRCAEITVKPVLWGEERPTVLLACR